MSNPLYINILTYGLIVLLVLGLIIFLKATWLGTVSYANHLLKEHEKTIKQQTNQVNILEYSEWVKYFNPLNLVWRIPVSHQCHLVPESMGILYKVNDKHGPKNLPEYIIKASKPISGRNHIWSLVQAGDGLVLKPGLCEEALALAVTEQPSLDGVPVEVRYPDFWGVSI